MIFPLLKKNIDTLLIAGLSGLLFWFIIAVVPNTDIMFHSWMLMKFHAGTISLPPNFLYYLLVYSLSCFSGEEQDLFIASGILLSIAVSAKYLITKKIVRTYLSNQDLNLSASQIGRISILLAFSMLFLFAIPDGYNVFQLKFYYLGRTTANIWHNSTTIALMPFALLLFWKQYKVLHSLEKVSNRTLFILSVLVIFNCIIKPSFLFVYIPITGLFLLHKFGFKQFRALLRNSIPLLVGAILILIFQALIYQYELGQYQPTKSKVELVRAFNFWLTYLPAWYIPFCFLLSYAFPIFFLVLNFKQIKGDKIFLYPIALVLFGLLLSIFIDESGGRSEHGNFTWQNHICCYILMLTTALLALKLHFKNQLPKWQSYILMALYLLHFVSGILYFVYMGYSKSFL